MDSLLGGYGMDDDGDRRSVDLNCYLHCWDSVWVWMEYT